MSPSSVPSGLTQDARGIWHCDASSAVSYPHDGNSTYLHVEDDSFWFRHRNQCIIAAMRCLRPTGYILDIGGGNGFVARGLLDAGFEVVVVEPGGAGSLAARRRGIETVICGAFQDIGFAKNSVPGAGLFDVLEHFEDDLALLSAVRDVLVPRGLIYITVPTYQLLFSDEDRRAGHFRRYTSRSLARTLARAGFEIAYRSYFFTLLPLPILASRTIPSWIGMQQSDNAARIATDHNVSGTAAPLIEHVFKWEVRRIAARRSLPFGSSCLAIGRKR